MNEKQNADKEIRVRVNSVPVFDHGNNNRIVGISRAMLLENHPAAQSVWITALGTQ
jgi:hypothetical protein